eukprot:TRINITY_DN75402_c0_g2_i1.p1 TRINITY_DN75402_c0_g2~~TRINITY_DN75402_c0_g2_i1.p1  ORF type:complete len:486 (+),score=180.97 TRINITY_DN75402_c0_g2_i1:58-1515(+)
MAETLKQILDHLVEASSIENSEEFAKNFSLEHQELVGALKSGEAKSFLVSTSRQQISIELTENGELAMKEGSPEFKLAKSIVEPISMLELKKDPGFKFAMKAKLIKKIDGNMIVSAIVEDTQDVLVAQLKAVIGGETLKKPDMQALKRRGFIVEKKSTVYTIKKGPRFDKRNVVLQTDLTTEMIENDEWEKKDFEMSKINLDARGSDVMGGYQHPLMKVRSEFRAILLGMGFEEMPSNKFVESSFWNFDSLYQPQSHPARDAHDTFFLTNPKDALTVPEEYLKIVKKTHEEGGFGSYGYHCDWKKSEAMKNILRTHTTAVSARMLYKLAHQEGGFKPAKYFSVDRVFRNETLDATHLAEFHQVEGLVADRNLTLGDLIGTIKEFFARIGITNLRFKPAFNPYTEPSMEIFGYHPDLGKWTEIGNSGIFRPEMLRPMGLPEDVKVIAWGLSLERPTMIKYGIDNIRDLFGHQVSIDATKAAPICVF